MDDPSGGGRKQETVTRNQSQQIARQLTIRNFRIPRFFVFIKECRSFSEATRILKIIFSRNRERWYCVIAAKFDSGSGKNPVEIFYVDANGSESWGPIMLDPTGRGGSIVFIDGPYDRVWWSSYWWTRDEKESSSSTAFGDVVASKDGSWLFGRNTGAAYLFQDQRLILEFTLHS